MELEGLKANPIVKMSCPNCGGTDTLAMLIERSKGTPQERLMNAHLMPPLMIPVEKMSLAPKVVVVLKDICLGCGTEWAKTIRVETLPTPQVLAAARNKNGGRDARN